MAGVYSVRFINVLAQAFVYYVVPNGKVAVIKSVTCVNDTTGTNAGRLTVAGTTAWYASVPGTSNGAQHGMHIVVRAGESIGVASNAPGMHWTVSGYLLDA